MDISKARRLVELEKEGRKILLTLWEGNLLSSCVEEKQSAESISEPTPIRYCETCQCDDEICQEYIDHLKSQGYGVTEVKLGELAAAESLPKFLEETAAAREVRAQPVVETEVIEHADIGTVEEVLGSPGELQPGESRSGSPETS